MTLIPIEDHVLIKPLTEDNITKAGIILPESKEKPRKGEIIAVGKGKILDNGQRSEMDLQIGDIVYFTQYAPDEIQVTEDGEKVTYLVIKQSSVLVKEIK